MEYDVSTFNYDVTVLRLWVGVAHLLEAQVVSPPRRFLLLTYLLTYLTCLLTFLL